METLRKCIRRIRKSRPSSVLMNECHNYHRKCTWGSFYKSIYSIIYILFQAKKQLLHQLESERNLKLGAFERVEELQRQVNEYVPEINTYQNCLPVRTQFSGSLRMSINGSYERKLLSGILDKVGLV